MIITREWIHAHKTPGGAWNRKQIEALGLSWPARKGWIKDMEGVEISSVRQNRFEKYGLSQFSKSTVDQRISGLEARIEELENTVRQLMPDLN